MVPLKPKALTVEAPAPPASLELQRRARDDKRERLALLVTVGEAAATVRSLVGVGLQVGGGGVGGGGDGGGAAVAQQ